MEYYSSIKRNAFESVLMRWMSTYPIIQSEVSQKELGLSVGLGEPEMAALPGSEQLL